MDADVVIVGPEAGLEPGYHAPSCSARGASSSRYVQPAGFELWGVVADLDTGTELQWSGPHSDELIYVLDGELEIDGRTCRTADAVIVESGAAASVRAAEPTSVVHFGSLATDPPTDGLLGPPAPDDHGVHVVHESELDVLGTGEGAHALYYADSTCPTCRITMLRNVSTGEHHVRSHTHSVDELIYLRTGEIRLGQSVLEAGSFLAIRGGRRYGFTGIAHDFINYRADVSMYVADPRQPGLLETLESVKTVVRT